MFKLEHETQVSFQDPLPRFIPEEHGGAFVASDESGTTRERADLTHWQENTPTQETMPGSSESDAESSNEHDTSDSLTDDAWEDEFSDIEDGIDMQSSDPLEGHAVRGFQHVLYRPKGRTTDATSSGTRKKQEEMKKKPKEPKKPQAKDNKEPKKPKDPKKPSP